MDCEMVNGYWIHDKTDDLKRSLSRLSPEKTNSIAVVEATGVLEHTKFPVAKHTDFFCLLSERRCVAA
jgi:hypothetical protein